MTNPDTLIAAIVNKMKAEAAITAIVPAARIIAYQADKKRSFFEALRNMNPPQVIVSWEQTGAAASQYDQVSHLIAIDVALETETKNLQALTAVMNMATDNAPWWRKPQQLHPNLKSIAPPISSRRFVEKSATADVDYLHISLTLVESC